MDLAYASAKLVAATPEDQSFFDGAPVLAVEILSPSDQLEDIVAKVDSYLEAASTVWVVNPYFRTIAVHRPGQPCQTLNESTNSREIRSCQASA